MFHPLPWEETISKGPPPTHPALRRATFSSNDLSTSGSGSGSTLTGFSRGQSVHLGCLQLAHSVPSEAPPSYLVLHSWHVWCATEFGPHSSPGYPYGYFSFLQLELRKAKGVSNM